MCPAEDSRTTGLLSKAQCGTARGLRRTRVACVVFQAADEKREPSGQLKGFPLLPKVETSLLEFDESAEPLPPLEYQLDRVPAGVLGAEPFDRDAYGVNRCIIDIGHVEPTDYFERVHPYASAGTYASQRAS